VTTIDRTSAGLRDILFDEIDALRKPKGNPQRALAVSALAKQIINTAEMEIRFQTLVGSVKNGTAETKLGTLPLGSSNPLNVASADETATAA